MTDAEFEDAPTIDRAYSGFQIVAAIDVLTRPDSFSTMERSFFEAGEALADIVADEPFDDEAFLASVA